MPHNTHLHTINAHTHNHTHITYAHSCTIYAYIHTPHIYSYSTHHITVHHTMYALMHHMCTYTYTHTTHSLTTYMHTNITYAHSHHMCIVHILIHHITLYTRHTTCVHVHSCTDTIQIKYTPHIPHTLYHILHHTQTIHAHAYKYCTILLTPYMYIHTLHMHTCTQHQIHRHTTHVHVPHCIQLCTHKHTRPLTSYMHTHITLYRHHTATHHTTYTPHRYAHTQMPHHTIYTHHTCMHTVQTHHTLIHIQSWSGDGVTAASRGGMQTGGPNSGRHGRYTEVAPGTLLLPSPSHPPTHQVWGLGTSRVGRGLLPTDLGEGTH